MEWRRLEGSGVVGWGGAEESSEVVGWGCGVVKWGVVWWGVVEWESGGSGVGRLEVVG